MDGYKVYKYYMAIKLHFTNPKYNVFETRGLVKGTRDTFNKRNDRFIFEKLGNRFPSDKDCIQFFVANFAYSEDTAFYGDEADDIFDTWRKRKESISKVFIDDLANIMNHCEISKLKKENIFIGSDGELPVLLTLFMGGKVTIETLRIIDDIEPYLDLWNNNQTIKIVMGDKLLRTEKLKGFVKYDSEKISKIYSHFKEELSL